MGCDPPGDDIPPSWLQADESAMTRALMDLSRVVESWSFRWWKPLGRACSSFVDRLDAWTLMEEAGFKIPPIMMKRAITHLVTEEG